MKARAIDSPQTRAPSVIKGILAWIRYRLPEGRALPDRIWHGRHRGVRLLLWFHAAGLAVFGVLTGHGLVPSTLEGGAIAITALLAGWTRRGRRFCAVVATIGLLTSSAVLVHFSGGYIEMHFHFFVMVGLITLYQDWTPFLLAIGYVVVHHGIMGALYPTSVYNHPAAWAHPWRWAAIHGVFVLAASVTNLIAWSLNEYRALHDPLTELANRALFRSRVERALGADQTGGRVAILFVDIDDFKTINNTFGHAAGDQLLVEIAERIRKCVRATDTPARIGGDEFAVLLYGIRNRNDAVGVASRIMDILRVPFTIGDTRASIQATVGISLNSPEVEDVDSLLQKADAAMYWGKGRGKGRYEIFDPVMA